MRRVRSFLISTYRPLVERWKYRVSNRKLSQEREELDGDCNHDLKLIRVRNDLDPEKTLETIIHEYLHAIYPFLCEEAVLSGGYDLAVLLRRLGYIHVNEIQHHED